jgi:hypothetical protein
MHLAMMNLSSTRVHPTGSVADDEFFIIGRTSPIAAPNVAERQSPEVAA